jgi:hypothetical protein
LLIIREGPQTESRLSRVQQYRLFYERKGKEKG